MKRGLLGTAAVVSLLAIAAHAQQPAPQTPQPEPPRFRTSVDVTPLDISVVDDRGKPVQGLAPEDFSVRIDGQARKVVSVEWISLVADKDTPPPPGPPDGYSSNESSTGGRLIVLAVDEPNIRFGGAVAITKAAYGFIDRLQPSDRVAVAGIGIGAPQTPFTADRARVKQAIGRMVGQKESSRTDILGHNIGTAEAMQVERGDTALLAAIELRECQGLTGPALLECRTEVDMQVQMMAADLRREGDQTINALRSLFLGLRRIEGAKTLVLVSEGFIMTDQGLIAELGGLAAAARTSLYVLRLENSLFDASRSQIVRDPFTDRRVQLEGLETLVGSARGTMFEVTGRPEALFERIDSEISGYYLVGVESDPRDRDGRTHTLRTDVNRRGVQVRSRRQLLNTPADERAGRTRQQTAAAALASPLIVSALPVRVASFNLQGPERDKVQVLIHADIGTDYAASKVTTVAYSIINSAGHVVETKAFDARLLPVMMGVPSPLQYKTGASLPPGDYTLKLAVVEGDRTGTVEHPIHAALPSAADLTFSELMVGGPVDVGELLQPTIGYQVTFGSVHGYFEAYGPRAGEVSVEYEVGTDSTSPALLNIDVEPRPAGDTRSIFTKVIQVHQLPPGKYLLRAIVSVNNRAVKTLIRGFEVAPPKVLMTSAEGIGATPVDTELYLPVDDATMNPEFPKEQTVAADTIAAFRERTPAETKAAFEQGVGFLTAGDYPNAEASFKRAIQPEVDSTSALTYLAVVFASAGRSIQAASAFQTALVDGDEIPQIFDWLANTFMRNHEYAEARAILEEAAGKWPSDERFTKPLAMLYATFGRGREAVRTLERYLEVKPDDVSAYYYAVQWFYMVHSQHVVVHNRAQDVDAARRYATAYEKAGGPQLPLVKQWLSYLESQQ